MIRIPSGGTGGTRHVSRSSHLVTRSPQLSLSARARAYLLQMLTNSRFPFHSLFRVPNLGSSKTKWLLCGCMTRLSRASSLPIHSRGPHAGVLALRAVQRHLDAEPGTLASTSGGSSGTTVQRRHLHRMSAQNGVPQGLASKHCSPSTEPEASAHERKSHGSGAGADPCE